MHQIKFPKDSLQVWSHFKHIKLLKICTNIDSFVHDLPFQAFDAMQFTLNHFLELPNFKTAEQIDKKLHLTLVDLNLFHTKRTKYDIPDKVFLFAFCCLDLKGFSGPTYQHKNYYHFKFKV